MNIRLLSYLKIITFFCLTLCAQVAFAAPAPPAGIAGSTEGEISSYLSTLPSCANTGDSFSFLNCNHKEDRSILYLEKILGDVGEVLQGDKRGISNGIMGALFNIYNIMVLSIGSVIICYTTIVSTINTAQEGEVMGKKWSSIWIPLRSATGIGFLLPLNNGYSLLQIILMWIIVNGIGAGNAVWETVMKYWLINGSINQSYGGVELYPDNIRLATENALKHVVCMEMINMNPDKYGIAINQLPDGLVGYEFGARGQTHPLLNNYTVEDKAKLCGSITIPRLTVENDFAAASDVTQLERRRVEAIARAVKFEALNGIYNELQISVRELLANGTNPQHWPPTQGMINRAIKDYTGTISKVDALAQASTDETKKILKDARETGWLLAGSFYHKLAKGTGSKERLAVQIPPTATDIKLPEDWKPEIEEMYNRIIAWSNDKDDSDQISIGGANLINSGSDELDKSLSGASKTMVQFVQYLSTNDPDPIVALQTVGSEIAIATEILFFTGLFIMIKVTVSTWAASTGVFRGPYINPAGWSISDVLKFVLPVVALTISILFAAAAMLSIYVPLIPYMVYTLAAITWMTIVVEALVAAPIIALGLIAPSQDHLGKAQPAVMLVANIFLRPSLMVIGFVAGSKMVVVGITLLNTAFVKAIATQISGLGFFGSLVIIPVYTAMALTVINKSFTLIHVLPDKVMRWIGGQAEQSTDARELEQTKSGTEQSAKKAGDMQSKTAAGAGKQIDKMQQDYKDMDKMSSDAQGGH